MTFAVDGEEGCISCIPGIMFMACFYTNKKVDTLYVITFKSYLLKSFLNTKLEIVTLFGTYVDFSKT